MKLSVVSGGTLCVAAMLLAAAPAASEESTLPSDLVPSLNSETYRQAIADAPQCIILYYRSDLDGTAAADNVMKALINALPPDVRFYKIDLRYFETAELERVVMDDIGRDVVPGIVPYRDGSPLDHDKVRGPPRKVWTDEIVKAYLKEFQPAAGGDPDRWSDDWPER